MPEQILPLNSLVLYKNQPALLSKTNDKKIEINLADGRSLKVRPKDVDLLHPGPITHLAHLEAPEGDVETAWELLQGSTATLPELAELAYAAYTPETAWAAWQLVADGLYFSGTIEAIPSARQNKQPMDWPPAPPKPPKNNPGKIFWPPGKREHGRR
ncbi:MAG: hypothetical protein IPH82_13425 [Chloroflexi bacterium]|nr:hypothetical protein [Chloroflexota bacterium]